MSTVSNEVRAIYNELKQGRDFINATAILLWLEEQPDFVCVYLRDAIIEKLRERETGERQGGLDV